MLLTLRAFLLLWTLPVFLQTLISQVLFSDSMCQRGKEVILQAYGLTPLIMQMRMIGGLSLTLMIIPRMLFSFIVEETCLTRIGFMILMFLPGASKQGLAIIQGS